MPASTDRGIGGHLLALGLCLIGSVVCACGSATESASKATDTGRAERAVEPGRHRALSVSGRYRVAIWPEAGALPLGQLHPWLVEVRSASGARVDVRQLVFDGGMPQHAHGFETRPQVTHSLGDGVFRVDGVRFHMAGAWKIRVDVAGSEGADVAFFDVEVGP